MNHGCPTRDPYRESIHAGGRGSGLDDAATRYICEKNQNVREKMKRDGEDDHDTNYIIKLNRASG